MNNKQQTAMKLYTEEQVKAMLIKTDKFTPLHIDHLMDEITPIELPSNEEVMQEIQFDLTPTDITFLAGINWMRDKILGGNK